MKETPRAPGLAKSVAFTLVLWAILLGLAEAGLRTWDSFRKAAPEWTDGQLFMCVPHATRIWAYKADHTQSFETPEFRMAVRTNAWRLRGGPVAEAPEATRVLVIGDSFTFGWGVEEDQRFSEVLAVRLRGLHPERPLAVLNAGHWMYTFDQQQLLLEELLTRWRPHLVLQGFYAPHLLTLMSHRWRQGWDGRLQAVHNEGIRVGPDGALRFTNSHLESPPFGSRVAAAVFRIWFNWRLSREAMTGDLALLSPAVRRYELAWEMAQTVARQTAVLARQAQAGYLAFNIPRDLLVGDAEWNDDYRKQVAGHELDKSLTSRRLARIFEQAGADWFDLLPDFRARYRPDLYYPVDPHWTPEGHRLAAELLAPRVAAMLESAARR